MQTPIIQQLQCGLLYRHRVGLYHHPVHRNNMCIIKGAWWRVQLLCWITLTLEVLNTTVQRQGSTQGRDLWVIWWVLVSIEITHVDTCQPHEWVEATWVHEHMRVYTQHLRECPNSHVQTRVHSTLPHTSWVIYTHGWSTHNTCVNHSLHVCFVALPLNCTPRTHIHLHYLSTCSDLVLQIGFGLCLQEYLHNWSISFVASWGQWSHSILWR